MKITFVLLALFCFGFQATVVNSKPTEISGYDSEVTDTIQEKSKHLIDKTKREFEMVTQMVQGIASDAMQSLERVIDEEKTKLTAIATQIEDKAILLKEKEGVFKACSDTYKNELETVKAAAQDELNACIDNAVGGIRNFNKGVENDDVRYKKFVEDELFKECGTTGRNTALRCAYGKLDEAAFAIRNVENETINGAYRCTVDANTSVARMVQKNGQTFQKCYADGFRN